jgi:hypothetical protein
VGQSEIGKLSEKKKKLEEENAELLKEIQRMKV